MDTQNKLANLDTLVSEIALGFITENSYCDLQKISKDMKTQVESFVIGSGVLDNILGGNYKTPQNMSPAVISSLIYMLSRVSGTQTCIRKPRAPDEVCAVNQKIRSQVVRKESKMILRQNYLYKLLQLEQKYPGELDSVLKHLDIYKFSTGSTFLRVDTQQLMITYTTLNTRRDIRYNYAPQKPPSDDPFQLLRQNYYTRRLNSCCRVNTINADVIVNEIEHTLTNAPNVLLFQDIYDCVVESRPNSEIDDIIRIGLDITAIPFHLLICDRIFSARLLENEYLCKKIIASGNIEDQFMLWVLESENENLIACLFTSPKITEDRICSALTQKRLDTFR